MSIIIPDKNKLYLQAEYPISSECRARIATLVEKLNYNSQIKVLLETENYNRQIKKLIKSSTKNIKTSQCNLYSTRNNKTHQTHPTRFKRGN